MEDKRISPEEVRDPREVLSRIVNQLVDMADFDEEPEIEVVELKGNEILFEQGSEGDSLYVLKAGVLGVRVTFDDGSESDIARLAHASMLARSW